MAWTPRWLVLTHRYVGIAIGLLMMVWLLSGIVMLFARWPSVDEGRRIEALAPIPWAACCVFPDQRPETRLDKASVEGVAGKPVLRLPDGVFDLTTGQPMAPLSADQASRVAAEFAARSGISGAPNTVEPLIRDQWTVTGYFNKHRPMWKVAFDDAAGSVVYVSAGSGKVVQMTDRKARVLNWLGAIPHWLYPAILRQDAKLWQQVVIWTSVVGTFLTLTGLYLGIATLGRTRSGRLSPYRGMMAWHHWTGLATGLLTLAWVFSGLMSMNPWGLLESGDSEAPALVTGDVSYGDLTAAIGAVKGIAAGQVRLAPLADRPFLIAGEQRLDATGRPAPLTPAELATAATRAGALRDQQMIAREDAYYYGHHDTVRLPAWRATLVNGDRLYLDSRTGEVESFVDAPARGFRWWHLGLHRFDVIPGFDRGAGWATAMVILLLAATFGVGIGVWLGFRRAGHDVGQLARWARDRDGQARN